VLGLFRGRLDRPQQVEVSRPVDVVSRTRRTPAESVPWPWRVAAEWAWRFVILGIALYFVLITLTRLTLLVFAFVIALLVCALLEPTVSRLRDLGVPRALATALVFVSGIAGIGLVIWFVVSQFVSNFSTLTVNVEGGVDQVREWLNSGPLQVSEAELEQYTENVFNSIRENSSSVVSTGVTTATYAAEIVSGLLIALFATFFLLYDGPRIWRWVVQLFPRTARTDVDGAGRRAWTALTHYIRGTVIVAFVDALFIGVGIYLIGVPLAVPLAALVFIGAFIPLVGATVSGVVAVLVALVSEGLVPALLVLGVILLVQQLEGHILQPFILGHAVAIHPLGVILAVTAGTLLAGIGGALIAVPIVAVVNSIALYFRDERAAAAVTDGSAPTQQRT
jgi:putative heme transporter